MTTDNIKFYSLIEAFALIQSVIVFAMIIIIMVNTYISMDKSQISLVILMQCVIILMLYWIIYGLLTVYKYIQEIMEAKA
jgi:hypothetical protein